VLSHDTASIACCRNPARQVRLSHRRPQVRNVVRQRATIIETRWLHIRVGRRGNETIDERRERARKGNDVEDGDVLVELRREIRQQILWVPETPSPLFRVRGGCGRWLMAEPVGSVVEVGRSRGVVLSFLYWMLRRLLELLVLRVRSGRSKELEIRVPRTHEEVWM
jgi:hypothetical protein